MPPTGDDAVIRTVRISDLRIDPELAAMVPAPLASELESLRESLRREGQKIPILVTPKGEVLDGNTRILLLEELGVETVLVQVVEGLTTREQEISYCIDVNLSRRQLHDFQRVELAVPLLDMERRRAAERRLEGARAGGRAAGRSRPNSAECPPDARREGNRHDKEAVAIVARRVGLKSGRQLEKGLFVRRATSPKGLDDLRNKRATINEVYSVLRAEARAAAAREQSTQIDDDDLDGEVIKGDGFKEGPELGTTALVIVDLPYGIKGEKRTTLRGDRVVSAAEALPGWDNVDAEALIGQSMTRIAELLAPTGSFYVFVDRRQATVAWEAATKAGLHPRNTLIWHRTNAVPSVRRNWSSAYELIVYGVKDPRNFVWNLGGDAHNVLRAPIVSGSKRLDHPTQKPLEILERVIEASSNPGDLVVDFMAGSGTTGAAAKRLGRRFCLVEIDPTYVDMARVRLAAGVGPPAPESCSRKATSSGRAPATRNPIVAEASAEADDSNDAVSASSAVEVASETCDVPRCFVGVVLGRDGYTGMIDSTASVRVCRPVPTTGRRGGKTDPDGVARLVESWASAGVEEVVFEPSDDPNLALWMDALEAHSLRHGLAPSDWRGRTTDAEAVLAFPDHCKPTERSRSSRSICYPKVRALLMARYLMLSRTEDPPRLELEVLGRRVQADTRHITPTQAVLAYLDAAIERGLLDPKACRSPLTPVVRGVALLVELASRSEFDGCWTIMRMSASKELDFSHMEAMRKGVYSAQQVLKGGLGRPPARSARGQRGRPCA